MDVFVSGLVLSFVLGGFAVSAQTLLAERFGSRLGGMLVALPSTSLVSFFFIGWAHSPEFAAQAASFAPASSVACIVFILLFVRLSEKLGAIVSLFCSLVAWLALSLGFIAFGFVDPVLAHALFFTCFFVALFLLRKVGEEKARFRFSFKQLLFRAVFAGAVIAFAVFVSKSGGPLLGGAFAMFPAAFSSSILILARSSGLKFARAASKGMFAGLVPLVFFALAVSFAYPALGLYAGTVASYFVALVVAVIVYKTGESKIFSRLH
ncbi:DUF3147 family protein [Candidatus Micrarchaeota archaeon]|nr:DUF3147 family protein [Candidatus Micrarchaeota archaeon]